MKKSCNMLITILILSLILCSCSTVGTEKESNGISGDSTLLEELRSRPIEGNDFIQVGEIVGIDGDVNAFDYFPIDEAGMIYLLKDGSGSISGIYQSRGRQIIDGYGNALLPQELNQDYQLKTDSDEIHQVLGLTNVTINNTTYYDCLVVENSSAQRSDGITSVNSDITYYAKDMGPVYYEFRSNKTKENEDYTSGFSYVDNESGAAVSYVYLISQTDLGVYEATGADEQGRYILN